MQRQVLLFLGLLLYVVQNAQAITITAGTHILLPNTPAQHVDIVLSGAGGSDVYFAADLRTIIGADGPRVTHVFHDTSALITPATLMDGSVWASQGPGQGGIFGSPDGTAPTDSGRRLGATFATNAFQITTANGLFATLTLDTTGIAPGVYAFNLTGHPYGDTTLFDYDEEELDFLPIDIVLVNGTLTVIPEPASCVIGLFAIAGLGVVAIGRRCARASSLRK